MTNPTEWIDLPTNKAPPQSHPLCRVCEQSFCEGCKPCLFCGHYKLCLCDAAYTELWAKELEARYKRLAFDCAMTARQMDSETNKDKKELQQMFVSQLLKKAKEAQEDARCARSYAARIREEQANGYPYLPKRGRPKKEAAIA